jgi:hypothetical protein
MAKAEWVQTSPSQGSGNGTVNVSSKTQYSGRVARQSVLTWKAANVDDVPRTVIQAGKPQFVDIDDAASADKSGKVVTISGVTNSARLTFKLGTGELQVSLPSTYSANSVNTSNGAAISGDPGATAEFPFSISIDVPGNDGTTSLSRQIIVEDEVGNRDVCLLTLAAGDAFITIAEGPIELDYLGTPVSVKVESNTNWTVE